jgi:hypothetical protein
LRHGSSTTTLTAATTHSEASRRSAGCHQRDGRVQLDRQGRLVAYGAIVTTADSEHEGARTAAARTLSESCDVVLKISVDGDITIFRDGRALTTLLGLPDHSDGDPGRG